MNNYKLYYTIGIICFCERGNVIWVSVIYDLIILLGICLLYSLLEKLRDIVKNKGVWVR